MAEAAEIWAEEVAKICAAGAEEIWACSAEAEAA